MKMTYKLCKILATKGKLTAEMLDVYLAAERITADQYIELIGLIKAERAFESNAKIIKSSSDILQMTNNLT